MKVICFSKTNVSFLYVVLFTSSLKDNPISVALYENISTEVDTYWEPHSAENDIYSQMSQHKYQEILPSGVTGGSHLGTVQTQTHCPPGGSGHCE